MWAIHFYIALKIDMRLSHILKTPERAGLKLDLFNICFLCLENIEVSFWFFLKETPLTGHLSHLMYLIAIREPLSSNRQNQMQRSTAKHQEQVVGLGG